MSLNLINPNEVTKEDFDKMVKINDFEVFSEEKVINLQKSLNDSLKKAEKDDFSEEDKDKIDILKAELDSLIKFSIVNDDLTKSLFYVRDKQVDFSKEGLEKGEFGEILNAKSGTFLDTELNRKLDRVGKSFGLPEKE